MRPMKNETTCFLLMLCALMGGCSDGETPQGGRAASETLAASSIGDACEALEPLVSSQTMFTPSSEQQAAVDRGEPVAFPVEPGYVDGPQYADGELFCLGGSSDSEFPLGYLTAKCKSDSVCGEDNACVDGLCRRLCTDDAECKAPTTCSKLADSKEARAFCRCFKCTEYESEPLQE